MALRSEYDLFEKLLETKNSIQEQGNGDKDSKIVSSDVIETSQDLESLRKPPTDISTVRVWEPESVESLDYDVVESEVYREDWRSRSPIEQYQYVTLKWLFALLIGVGTGLVSFGINMSVENISGLKFQTVLFFMNKDLPLLAGLVYTGCNVVLVLSASLLCVFLSPAAAGSGIPEVKAYLNGVDLPNILSLKTFFVKIFGSIGSVGGGLLVGKEGPLVHTGACLASIFGQGGSSRFGLTHRWLRLFKNDRDRRDLVSCGAAGGVAAAFRAPVGGVLFALEEVTSWWRSPLLWRAFFTNAVVAVVLRYAMSLCSKGRCGLYGSGGFIIFDQEDSLVKPDFGLFELLPVAVLGVVGGVLGSLFNRLNLLVCSYRRDIPKRSRPWLKILDACLIALLTSVVQFSVPWFGGRCQPCPQQTKYQCPQKGRIGNFKMFNCPEGQYNDLATLLFNSNDDTIRNLFSAGTEKEFSYGSLLVALTSTYSLALVTYGISVPSGLFVPCILAGATYGRLTGRLMAEYGGVTRINEGTYALLGSASFLGGAMRMTVSICVILLELTGNLTMLPLLMLVLLVAKLVGDIFSHAIYDSHLRFKQVPILEANPPMFMKRLSALDAMQTRPVVNFQPIENVGHIFQTLKDTTHNAFPVVGDYPNPGLQGVILRSHLLVLLKGKRAFQKEAVPLLPSAIASYSSVFDFGKPGSGKGLSVEDVSLSPEEEDMFLDLLPFVNKSPYTVSESMSLFKVYHLFRQLGLRHLCVVPSPKKVVGMITRKDLLPESYNKQLTLDSRSGSVVGSHLTLE